MIRNLKLENFIIVDNLELTLDSGLQVLSGETGAGKSIIVGAIDLIFGSSLRPGVLYDESKPAKLEVVLDLDKENKELVKLLQEYEIDPEEEELCFTKEISTGLKARTYLNGRRISQNIVTDFRSILLDFHSQRDQQRLLDENYQLEVLDLYGGLETEREGFNFLFREFTRNITELNELRQKERDISEKIKLYEYQADELTQVKLQPGEDERLQNEINLLSHAEEIMNLCRSIEHNVFEREESVYDILNSFLGKLIRFQDDNVEIGKAVSYLQEVMANLDEVSSAIRYIQNIISIDESLMMEVETRLNAINTLKAKYKTDLQGMMVYLDKIRTEISNYSTDTEKIERLAGDISNKAAVIKKKALELSERRKKIAQSLEKELEKNIRSLAMPEGQVKIRFDINKHTYFDNYGLESVGPFGQDQIEILFSANKGVRIQPLKMAASGGELSRFLLTVKKVLTDRLDRRTIVFDEIDSGIGGRTAELLGEFICRIGEFHQVICVTHLAQIASYAQRHYAIEKKSGKEKTQISLTLLRDEERKKEIARMLAGSQTELALKYAEEILKKEEKSYGNSEKKY